MFEKFTDRARRVLVLAQHEAREAGHEALTVDHVLLGCVIEHDGIAGRVLETFSVSGDHLRNRVVERAPRRSSVSPVEAAASVGVNLLEVKEAVEQAFGAGSFALPGERPPFSAAARDALKASIDASLEWGHNYVGTEHLLLGILRPEGGEARLSLEALGISPHEVEERTRAVVHRYAIVEHQPNRDRARALRRGVQRLPAEVKTQAREVLDDTVNAQPVMPLVASDAKFELWLSESEAQLGMAVDRARARLDSLGVLRFVDAIASLMDTAEFAEVQVALDGLRDERDKQQTSEADDEESVSSLARAVRHERRASALVDELWEEIWSRRADLPGVDFVGRVTELGRAISALS